MKATVTWIVIANGTQARIVRNEGPGKGVKPGPDRQFSAANLPGREIMADRPGRTFDSGGQGRHAKEPRSDPREVEQQKMLRELARYLDQEGKKGAYDRLVIVAPPRALGSLRAGLSAQTRGKVSGEMDKDLTQVAIHDLPGHLGALLAV